MSFQGLGSAFGCRTKPSTFLPVFREFVSLYFLSSFKKELLRLELKNVGPSHHATWGLLGGLETRALTPGAWLNVLAMTYCHPLS